MTVTVIALPVVVLPILYIESIHSGSFSWEFFRAYSSDSDSHTGWLFLILFLMAMAGYYFHCLMTGRPTLGQYSFGYNIHNDQNEWDRKSAIKRIALTMISFWIWPIIAIIAATNKTKSFFYDKQTNSYAARFGYVVPSKD